MGRTERRLAVVVASAWTSNSAAATEATVRCLHDHGMHVVVADADRSPWNALMHQLGHGEFAELDLVSEASWSQLIDAVLAQHGRVDALVTNIRIRLEDARPVVGMSFDLFDEYVRLNLHSAFLGARAVLPAMIAAGSGSIVNVASIDALRGVPSWAPYVAANHALVGLTRSIALEVAATGVRVNAVCASPNTGIAGDIGASTVDHLLAQVPQRRLATPEEIAGVVGFLTSDESAACTGSVIVVDNGRLAGPSPAATTTQHRD